MLPDDETNQEPIEEAKVDVAQAAQPHEGGEPRTDDQPTTEGAPESAFTLEEVESLKAFQQQMRDANITDPKALMADYTRKSQSAAESARENEQLRQALGAFAQQQQLQQDPVASAQREYDEALQTFDPAAISAAQHKLQTVREQKLKQELFTEFVQASRVDRESEQVRDRYGYDQQKLASFYQQMTPKQIADALAISEGRYDDVTAKEREAAERKAAEAAAIGRLMGDGSAGVVPGSIEGGQKTTIPWVEFAHHPPEQQQKWLAEGVIVTGAPSELVREE
jgi:hypothetical protein